VVALSDNERQWFVRPEGYEEDEDPKAHEKLLSVMSHIEREQDRKRTFLLYAAMYAGGVPPAGGGLATDAYVRTTPRGKSNLSINLSRLVTDAVVSRVFAKAKPKLKHVTEGGGPERQEHARQLTQGIDGVFYETKGYDKFVDAGRYGCVYGTGSTRTYADMDTRQVAIDTYAPWERILDDGEVYYDRPMSFYAAKYVDRYVLANRVRRGIWARGDESELAAKARLCDLLGGETDEDAEFGYDQVGYRVLKREAWRYPSGKGAGDGRYVLCVKNCTLIDEPWDGEDCEFSDFRWTKPIVGFYGQGIVELGSGLQAEVNKLVRLIQQGHHMIPGRWLVANGSGVLKAHINNDLTTILNHNPGLEPKYVVPAIIAPEVYAWVKWLVAEYFSMVGISEQAATATVPQGLKSGEAQREYANQQNETLLDKGARYEQFVKENGDKAQIAAKKLADKGAYEVRAMADDGFETIDWSKLEEADGIELQVMPTSSLPSTIAGRVDLAYDLMQIGEYDAQDVTDMIGMPDGFQRTALKRGSAKLVMKRVGRMLVHGEPWAAPSYINLAEALVIAGQMLCLAEEKNVGADEEVVPEENLQLVRDFLVSVQQRIKEGQPPPPDPMMGPGGNMLGPGAAPPVLPGTAGPPGAPPPGPAGAPPAMGGAPPQGMAA
jgi:hypothetical protein